MGDRGEFIRESMRRSWGGRVAAYTTYAAPRGAVYTEALLVKVGLRPGEHVLDVATGPGVVALAAAAVVGPTGRVVATDLAPEWGPIIARRAADAGLTHVTFEAMGAEALAFPESTFDVALCQFGLMFVPQPITALREMRRVLRPGGRLGVVVWSTAEMAPCIDVPNRVLASVMPPPAPEDRLPGPLELAEPGLLEGLIAEAGLRDVTVERQTRDYVLDDSEDFWRYHVEEGREPVRAAVAALSAGERRRLHDTMIAALEPYRRAGAIRLPSEVIYATARR